MDATVSALLGSLIGASAALIGSAATNLVSIRNEARRALSARHLADLSELRERIGTAAGEFMVVMQIVEYSCWLGSNNPEVLTKDRIARYEEEVHESYKELLSAMARTASLSFPVYEDMQAYLEELYGLEEKVALALARGRNGEEDFVSVMKDYGDEAKRLDDRVMRHLHDLMREAQSRELQDMALTSGQSARMGSRKDPT